MLPILKIRYRDIHFNLWSETTIASLEEGRVFPYRSLDTGQRPA